VRLSLVENALFFNSLHWPAANGGTSMGRINPEYKHAGLTIRPANAVAGLIIAAVVCCAGCREIAFDDHQPTAYELELVDIDNRLATLEQGDRDAAVGRSGLKRASLGYTRASLTGDFEDYRAAETALVECQTTPGCPSPDWYFLSASLNFSLHRLDRAEADLVRFETFGDSDRAVPLAADIAFQRGDYQAAETAYTALGDDRPRWDNLARLAWFRFVTGEPELADSLYVQAQALLSVKEMRHFAWLELQRGVIDLAYGRHRMALDHYLRAEQAYSGYWLVREHIAEVLALLGRRDEAKALYRKLITQTRNPEFVSALAVIYEQDRSLEAADLYRQADARFADNLALYPEAAGGHLIKSLLARQQPAPGLLEHALRNHSLRPNAEAKLLLAESCLKLGDRDQARQWLRRVMASPWRTPKMQQLAVELQLAEGGAGDY